MSTTQSKRFYWRAGNGLTFIYDSTFFAEIFGRRNFSWQPENKFVRRENALGLCESARRHGVAGNRADLSVSEPGRRGIAAAGLRGCAEIRQIRLAGSDNLPDP